MDLDRRQYLKAAAPGLLVMGAGCLGDDGTDGCEIQTMEEHLVDEWETVAAGNSLTWRFDLEVGDELDIDVRQTGGQSRPRLIVEDPSGAEVLDVGPQERIHREITADQDGRYYVEFYNEALVNSGEWDMDVTMSREFEPTDC